MEQNIPLYPDHNYLYVSQLPIYGEPVSIHEEKPMTTLKRIENVILKVRETLLTTLLLETPKRFDDKIQANPDLEKVYEILPRIGLIGLAGMGGVIMTSHKHGMKKPFNCFLAMAVMSYLCFPNQVATITAKEYGAISRYAGAKWNDFVKSPQIYKSK